jgi:arsenate reductase
MDKQKQKKVLFLCTHSSARSQMAEGLLQHFGGNSYQVYSAGTEKTGVRPQAIQAIP